MKTWIKRTLIGVVAAGALLGGIAAAWGSHHHRWHRWDTLSDADRAALRERAIDRVASKLDLDAAQRARLAPLADALQQQAGALRGTTTQPPRAELQALIAGNTFDRTAAQRLVQAKLDAVTKQSPAVLTAFGDFYDGLRPNQQARVREFLERGRRRHGS